MDTKDRLPPIPTPASQRWREFRIQVLPFLMFGAIVVAIVLLWRGYVQPIGVIGFAETNQVNVTSLGDGLVEHLYVESFQVVTQGQIIAEVLPTSADVVRATSFAAQKDLEVLRDRMKIDIARVLQNIYDSEQKLLDYTVGQGSAREDLLVRSNDYQRAKQQLADKTLAVADFERIQGSYNVLATTILERDKAITNLRASLKAMRDQSSQDQGKSVDEAIAAREAELAEMLKPSILRAPIDGMVSMVHRRQGERILRGDPVATIVDRQVRRVIGYIRQPVSLLPGTNDIVKIIKRTAPTAIGQGRIERIGAQFEFINPALLSADTKRLEVGLPILVSVPPGFPLVPGEYVTLNIDYVR